MFANNAAMPFRPATSFRLCASRTRTTYPGLAAGASGFVDGARGDDPAGIGRELHGVESLVFVAWLAGKQCGMRDVPQPQDSIGASRYGPSPSAERQNDVTASGCRRFKPSSDFPVATSHCTTVWSVLAESTRRPSGRNAAAFTSRI